MPLAPCLILCPVYSFPSREILRGAKVVVFPEGRLVKDRRVIDPHGQGHRFIHVPPEKDVSSPARNACAYPDTFKAEVGGQDEMANGTGRHWAKV